MELNDLQNHAGNGNENFRMPVLFLGHGSPMNAIEENEFVRGWKSIGNFIPAPSAIVCVSAHWETDGTRITAMEKPRTIHDFGGFPAELYKVQYPAPGNPPLAYEIIENIKKAEAFPDEQWGLDHGCWSVVKHLYPAADIPVLQVSLDFNLNPRQHFELARDLSILREKDILIIGSGNMVHNLGLVAWNRLNEPYGYDWALEANEKMKELILSGDHDKLVNYNKLGRAFELAIPTPEHYLPLLYVLAQKNENDIITIFNDKPVGGSLTMTCLMVGDNKV
jgi:4,5-DOPA dioxygenase extradiol